MYENVGYYRQGDYNRTRLAIAHRAGRTPPDEEGDWFYPDDDSAIDFDDERPVEDEDDEDEDE